MLSVADVKRAAERIEGRVRHTPTERSIAFSRATGADVRLKLEAFQRTGAFKLRGATNRIATLSPDERAAGVVTASAGNHAQGVALAASREGVDATIVMPEYAPISKVKATRDYGGDVVLHGADYAEAQERAHGIEREAGRTYVHAFDDWEVMAGQGTLGLEIAEDCPELDAVVVPIGGGGLIAGVATAIADRAPDARVIGVQAAGADSAARSLETGGIHELDSVDTIADGIATRSIGERPFAVIRERVDEVVTVSDGEIAQALTLLLERSKVLAEGAGAVPLAAITTEAFAYDDDETIVAAICGGNVDMNRLTTVLVRGLVRMGRYLKFRTVLKDRPGALEGLVEIIAGHGANINAIHHDRTSKDVAVNAAEVEIELETHDADHVAAIVDDLQAAGYPVEIVS